jgi:hypothetical protein
VDPDLPVPYWPAYLPTSDTVRAEPVPYWPTPLAEAVLPAVPATHPGPDARPGARIERRLEAEAR